MPVQNGASAAPRPTRRYQIWSRRGCSNSAKVWARSSAARPWTTTCEPWWIVNVNQSTNLNCVDYMNGNNVFIGGDSLTYTNNGGTSWTNKPIHNSSGNPIPGSTF